MLRALYSAVSGLKSHQTELDTIGNNIANVNTYGFKSSRTRFQDVFYQTMSSASASTGTRGGTNASQMGYGTQVAGVDLNMSRSSFQATDNALDLAIAGEGFFQVMDSDGNVFYTRAGVLQIDSGGNLCDANGNIVLGVSGNPLGRGASSERIRLNVPNVPPTRAEATETVNDIAFTITAENTTDAGNISLNFVKGTNLPDGSDVMVYGKDITTGAIIVNINETAVFDSLETLNQKVNQAITAGNGGPHPAGNFTIRAVPSDDLFPPQGLTGAEIIGTNFSIKEGSITLPANMESTGIFGSMRPKSVSTDPMFLGTGEMTYNAEYQAASADGTTPAKWIFTAVCAGNNITYRGEVTSISNTAKSVLLKQYNADGTPGDGSYIEMSHPGFDNISSAWRNDDAANKGKDPSEVAEGGGTAAFKTVTGGMATASSESKDIGLSTFNLTLGTVGGPQTAQDCSIAISDTGIIEAVHPNLGRWQMGRIDLVTFENPGGLTAVGNSYYQASANSGTAKSVTAGSGGSGTLKGSALEMSNVDISSEFTDMIVAQRGFQANSRIISVADEILNELVNLNR